MTSTDARNRFGHLLELVASGATVIITRRGVPLAVALPPDLNDTRPAPAAPSPDELTAEFDAMLERMQTPEASAGIHDGLSAFTAARGTPSDDVDDR